MPETPSVDSASSETASRNTPPILVQIAPVWARFLALLLDGLIWMPAAFAVAWISSVSLRAGIILFPLGLVAFVAYQMVFHARYGATFGKMILRLRVLRADDLGPIDATAAIKRSFVDAVIRLSTATIAAKAILGYGGALPTGDVLVFLKIFQAHPSYVTLSNIGSIWTLSEVVTALLNPRRRSLHDLIGGTVVVRKSSV
jgi:uncharacterized RDD family membrane protein YckC